MYHICTFYWNLRSALCNLKRVEGIKRRFNLTRLRTFLFCTFSFRPELIMVNLTLLFKQIMLVGTITKFKIDECTETMIFYQQELARIWKIYCENIEDSNFLINESNKVHGISLSFLFLTVCFLIYPPNFWQFTT